MSEQQLELHEEKLKSEEGSGPSSSPPWGKQAWLFLFSALAAAGCYFFCHSPFLFPHFSHLPGIGFTLTQWLLTGVTLAAAASNGCLRFRGNYHGVFLLFVSLGLGACFSLFANDVLRAMNLPVACLTSALSLFSLCGANPLPALSSHGILKGLSRLLPSCFRYCLMPVRALSGLRNKHAVSKLRGLGTGLILALPVAFVALFLLISADPVYGAFLQDMFSSLNLLDGAFFLRLAFTALCSLALFSLLTSAMDVPWEISERPKRSYQPVTLSTVLTMLIVLYGLFVYVQFRYLFGGADTAVMAGGYAEYARSGFFQLVILSILTLTVILPFLQRGKSSWAVRLLCAVTAVLTGVIDFSAFFRMRLYIQAYGLSILRLVTLWGIAMIMLALLAALLKCALPDIRICPALASIALSSWLLLNLLNMDRITARNQVELLNRGVIRQIDITYLSSMSPCAAAEMKKIRDPSVRDASLQEAAELLKQHTPCAYDWSFDWLSVSAYTEEH